MKKLITILFAVFLGMMIPFASAHDQSRATINVQSTLYDDLGGEPAIRAIIDHMLELALDDPKMSPIFENSNIDRLKGILFIHTCHIAEGPCEYKGQDMRRAHDGLGIRTWHFNKLVENMQSGMDAQDIPFRVQNRLMARLAPFHDDVTGRSPVPPRNKAKPESYSHTPHGVTRSDSEKYTE